MLDATDLLNAVKKAAVDATNAGQPTDFLFGKVTSAKPLKILVEQKMTLSVAQLVLSRAVTDYRTRVTIDWEADDQSNSIKGTKEMTVRNALKTGDEVILLKKKGGQKYLVLDRVVKA